MPLFIADLHHKVIENLLSLLHGHLQESVPIIRLDVPEGVVPLPSGAHTDVSEHIFQKLDRLFFG